MTKDAEDRVSKFYNSVGWKTADGITEDARQFEDLREHAKEYVSRCRLRVLRHIPKSGENILDMASGPIQYKEYLEYSRNFKKRYCVDLSLEALDAAKEKIGDHGVYLHGSFFDLTLEENFFDCAISLHTIYHMDKDKQEEAVRKLLKVIRPGKPVVIVYSNNKTLLSYWRSSLPCRVLRRLTLLWKRHEQNTNKEETSGLYFYAHPINWWDRFDDVAEVKILPWRSFLSDDQKRLIPNNIIGRKMFALLFALEDKFPDFFAKNFTFPMIVLTKRQT